MTGAQMVVRALVDQGVTDLFGYPGGAVLPIYDALFHEPRLRHILVRHEQGATHVGGGLCALHRQARRGAGDVRPRARPMLSPASSTPSWIRSPWW